MKTDLKEDVRNIKNRLALTMGYSRNYPWLRGADPNAAAEVCLTPSAGPLLSSELLQSVRFCCLRFCCIQGEGLLVRRIVPWHSGLAKPRCLLSRVSTGDCSHQRYRNWSPGAGRGTPPRSNAEITINEELDLYQRARDCFSEIGLSSNCRRNQGSLASSKAQQLFSWCCLRWTPCSWLRTTFSKALW